ncbi:MAG: hypothetical protein JOZ05_12515 [Acetobacteraceae bacterium]|nr:hypothetical protein [Acetobacteraceae bacterium]
MQNQEKPLQPGTMTFVLKATEASKQSTLSGQSGASSMEAQTTETSSGKQEVKAPQQKLGDIVEIKQEEVTRSKAGKISFTVDGVDYKMDTDPFFRSRGAPVKVVLIPKQNAARLATTKDLTKDKSPEERKRIEEQEGERSSRDAKRRRELLAETEEKEKRAKEEEEAPLLEPVLNAFKTEKVVFEFDPRTAYKHCATGDGQSEFVGEMDGAKMERWVEKTVREKIDKLQLAYASMTGTRPFQILLGNRENIVFFFKNGTASVRHVGPGV